MTQQTRFKLNTGASIPAIGFGTFQDPDAQEDAVSRALEAGLRLIDGQMSVGALIGSFSGACATLGGRVGQRIDSFIMRCIDIFFFSPK